MSPGRPELGRKDSPVILSFLSLATSEALCMSYQHRNWVKVTTSYPKQAKKTCVKRHFPELRCTDPRRVTMLVIHTRSFAALRMTGRSFLPRPGLPRLMCGLG